MELENRESLAQRVFPHLWYKVSSVSTTKCTSFVTTSMGSSKDKYAVTIVIWVLSIVLGHVPSYILRPAVHVFTDYQALWNSLLYDSQKKFCATDQITKTETSL